MEEIGNYIWEMVYKMIKTPVDKIHLRAKLDFNISEYFHLGMTIQDQFTRDYKRMKIFYGTFADHCQHQ